MLFGKIYDVPVQNGEAEPQSLPVEGGAEEQAIEATHPAAGTLTSDSKTKVMHPPSVLVINPGLAVPV